LLYRFYFYYVGVAGVAVCHAAGDDDVVTRLKRTVLFGKLLCGVKYDVERIDELAHNGSNAPGKSQLAPCLLLGGNAENIYRASEAGYHTGCHARNGAYCNRLCIDVDSHAAGGVGDCIYCVSYNEIGSDVELQSVGMITA